MVVVRIMVGLPPEMVLEIVKRKLYWWLLKSVRHSDYGVCNRVCGGGGGGCSAAPEEFFSNRFSCFALISQS